MKMKPSTSDILIMIAFAVVVATGNIFVRNWQESRRPKSVVYCWTTTIVKYDETNMTGAQTCTSADDPKFYQQLTTPIKVIQAERQ